jgi:D-amino-acid dehydrogenase
MKILVLGAGIAGVTTAYELWRDGHEVAVIDRETEPAAFSSHANAGLFAPGHSYAWSSPTAPKTLLRSLWRNDQALRLRPTADRDFWRWMWKFWRQCTAERAALNTARKARLCNYSRTVFHETLNSAEIQFAHRTGGLVYFYRREEELAKAAAKAAILTQNGCDIDVLDREQTIAKEPALRPVKERIAGALFAGNDESGDCRLFALGMARWLAERGVQFKYGMTIASLDSHGGRVSGVTTNGGRETAEAYVLCLGVFSPQLARPLGDELPIYPVKGYSVTLPVASGQNAPALGGVDEENLIAYCPLGDRLRITATAEFSGYGRSHSPDDFRYMLGEVRALFPDGADYSRPQYWAGLRPMTPEGTPILGQGRQANLWYNTGLGHMGWTMSHATARITADLIGRRKPAIPLDGMTLS